MQKYEIISVSFVTISEKSYADVKKKKHLSVCRVSKLQASMANEGNLFYVSFNMQVSLTNLLQDLFFADMRESVIFQIYFNAVEIRSASLYYIHLGSQIRRHLLKKSYSKNSSKDCQNVVY